MYYRCLTCGGVFISAIPSQKTFKKYYEKLKMPKDTDLEGKLRSRAQHILGLCKRLNPEAVNLLDIGCGKGTVLEEARLFGLHSVGIEPSVDSSTFIQSHYAGTVHTEFFPTSHSQRFHNSFDIVILSHIVEHVRTPYSFIGEAIRCLTAKGTLVIETPNAASWLAHIEKNSYTFLTPPEHVFIFTPLALRIILDKQAVKVKIVRTETFSEPEHCMGMLRHLFFGPTKNISTIPAPPGGNKISLIKRMKYLFFDKIIVRLFIPFFNMGNRGSILRVYVCRS
jgi:SAM-dependent methyltransferase